ncbi:hypothetical protein [Microbulbifer sp. ZKSA002]|uniref:hypothetical protein n=1 Tax=Microbulbifer sp. ZKSA002 TaxID=3243388 RepID=UPI0040390D5A
MIKNYLRKMLRSVVCFLLSLYFFLEIDGLFWVALLILGVFFVGVDIFHMDKSLHKDEVRSASMPSFEYGVLGQYIIDSTYSYGMFIELLGRPVFIDVKKDGCLSRREEYAKFLYEHIGELEANLRKFCRGGVGFDSKFIDYIGLHSPQMEEGEVFWSPEGYTKLYGLDFKNS